MKISITKGESYLCVKDYVMDDKTIAFKKDIVYFSDKDGCLNSDFSDEHEMEDESNFWEYFKPYKIVHTKDVGRSEKEIFKELCKDIKPMSKTLKIELRDWHHQCADGCCDNYGTDIYLNGERLDEQYADDSKNALTAVLEKLGYKVDITSY